MPDIILSICIPTYNRGRILYENIKNWLKTSNQNFEIIVSDNCSDDNTLELLNSIDDNRLVILTNEKNMGGFINGNRTLLSGRGKYLMYLTDKDLISMEYFDDIIETLKNNDFATGRFVLNYKQNNCYLRRYTSKIKALRTVCSVALSCF